MTIDKGTEWECVKTSSEEELWGKARKMREMQLTHNALAADFEALVTLTVQNQDLDDKSKPLIRACIKEMFSLIEGDLYLINQYLPYEGYEDFHPLEKKFKKTYKHHARTFNKTAECHRYQSTSFRRLIDLKAKRDQIIHPKGRLSLQVTLADLASVKQCFHEYRTYIQKLMRNIGFEVELPLSSLF
jgi:hypothetical protein